MFCLPLSDGCQPNLAAADMDPLTAIIKNRLKSIRYRPGPIAGFLAQTGLTLEPEPP